MDCIDEMKMGPEGQLSKLESDLHQKSTAAMTVRNQIISTENEVELWKRTLRAQVCSGHGVDT